jgi:hypothetical protein
MYRFSTGFQQGMLHCSSMPNLQSLMPIMQEPAIKLHPIECSAVQCKVCNTLCPGTKQSRAVYIIEEARADLHECKHGLVVGATNMMQTHNMHYHIHNTTSAAEQ